MINTTVVFIIFNRPETTEKVFQSIRAAKPAKLMVIADGPRKGKAGEAERCSAARAIIDGVDWPCEIQKNYSDVNLGCKRRVSSGLDWVFGKVEQAIILEDDCLPHPTFYQFCEEMLERYRDDERVWQIGANNFHFGEKRTEYSYYFSRYNQIWGWASWRRAWKFYDVEMKLWPQLRDGRWLYDMLEHEKVVVYWRKKFEKTYMGEIDTWDYQWTFTMWAYGGLSVLPNDNLVSNIGYGPEATHCIDFDKRAEVPVMPIAFPLTHPPLLSRNAVADHYIQSLLLPPPRHVRKYNMLKRKFKKIKKALYLFFDIVPV